MRQFLAILLLVAAVAVSAPATAQQSRAYHCTADWQGVPMGGTYLIGPNEWRERNHDGSWGSNQCDDPEDHVTCRFEGSKFIFSVDEKVEQSVDVNSGEWFETLPFDLHGTCTPQSPGG